MPEARRYDDATIEKITEALRALPSDNVLHQAIDDYEDERDALPICLARGTVAHPRHCVALAKFAGIEIPHDWESEAGRDGDQHLADSPTARSVLGPAQLDGAAQSGSSREA